MKNNQYTVSDVRSKCESKLGIEFRKAKEFQGWFYCNGKKIARITVAKAKGGQSGIPKGTYKSMANQLKITIKQFDDFLACPFKYEHYLMHLKNTNVIEADCQ